VEEACRQRVMIGRFPVCALYLTLPYETVDVNVHPNKWEVRFQDERGVAEAVRNLVQDALSQGAAQVAPPPLYPPPAQPAGADARVSRSEPADSPPAAMPPPIPSAGMRMRSPAWEQAAVLEQRPADEPVLQEVSPPAAEPEQVHAAEHVAELALTPVRLIGAAFNTYILYESGDTICLCDQHAMHERLMFDRLMKAYDTGAIAQLLLLPQAVALSYREYGSFVEHRELLAQAGYDAEDFGEQTVRLRSVPIMLGQPQAERSFREALDELAATGALSDDKRVEKIIMASCKQAVKGGERLPDEALIALVRGVLDGNVTPTCPHGRPLMMQLTRTELEKRFQRIPG